MGNPTQTSQPSARAAIWVRQKAHIALMGSCRYSGCLAAARSATKTFVKGFMDADVRELMTGA
ncbi:hypothetical protein SBV1_1380002 [Verrucomicrobia bacterium]|nr:hypothetical protein SBV1_1380002 [Verrucomicrobiota bacterium]